MNRATGFRVWAVSLCWGAASCSGKVATSGPPQGNAADAGPPAGGSDGAGPPENGVAEAGAPNGRGQDAAGPHGILAGVAAEDITPQWPVAYEGGDGDHLVSKHYRNLEVKALVVTDPSNTSFAFVTMDIVDGCHEISDAVYARVATLESAKQAGLSRPEQIILNASHIHSTPAVCPLEILDPMDLDLRYQGVVVDKVVKAIDRALTDRRPAALGTADGSCDICINRDGPPHGIGDIIPNPGGPIDRRVRVLTVKDPANDQLRAVLALFGCHPSDMAGTFGGDYFGFGRDEAERQLPGVVVLTAQGTAGDVRLDDAQWKAAATTDQEQLARNQAFGKRFGEAIVQAARKPAVPVRGQIVTGESSVDLPMQAQTKVFVDAAAMGMFPVYKADPYVLRWAHHLLSTYYDKGLPVPRTWGPYSMRIMHFGDDFTVAALDGEIFTCIGRQIEESLSPAGSARRTFVFGYTNDVRAYVPCAENFALGEGGYEINVYWWWLQPAKFEPSVDSVVVNAAVALAQRLRQR